MARVTGPVVTGINVMFLSDWYSETDEILRDENVRAETIPIDDTPNALDCQIVPSGPGFEGENNLQLFLTLIYSAQYRVVDIRSFSLDLEVSMLVRGKSFVTEIRAVEDDYRSISRELTLSEWKNEPCAATVLDGIARLTSSF